MGTLGGLIVCSFLVGLSYGTPVSLTYDTIVIGLGPAGSSAASTLAKAGKRVLALEAQNRVGGRVNTVPFGDGIIEMGAEWIHGTDSSSIYELAIKNNVSIIPQKTSLKVYNSDGTSDKEDIVKELITFALDLVDDPPKDPEPLGQYLTRRIREHIKTNYPSLGNDTKFDDTFLEFMDLLINTYESSNSWNDISTESSYHELGGDQGMSWHKNGYKTLFDILLNTYNNGPGYPSLEIKLNTEVTKIQWPQDPKDDVVVTVKDGTTYTAKTAIVTVSVGVLKERYKTLFSPVLPEQKSRPIEAIEIGVCDKIILRFAERWWPAMNDFAFLWRSADRAGVSEADSWLLKTSVAGTSMASNNTLGLWTCGNAAKTVETLPEDVVKRKVMELIRKFMGVGKTIPEPVEMIRSNWYSNPFTRGSYSYDGLQTPQYPAARADLARPLSDCSGAPRLLFAGEATDNTHFSTVHGAVDSGRREAERLLSTSK